MPCPKDTNEQDGFSRTKGPEASADNRVSGSITSKAGIGSPAAASRRISSILDIGVPAYSLPRTGLKLKSRIGEKIRVGREAARLRVIEDGISFDAMNTAISGARDST